MSYQWTPPSLIPSFLPWLAILLLLLVKSNRCGRAWWIWLPLGCVAVMEHLSQSAFEFLPSGTADIFLEMAGSLVIGVAAVWLLAPQLARSHRILTFLCFAPTLAGFTLFSFLVRQDWSEDGAIMALGMLVPLAISVLVVAAAVLLAGLACRGRYRPLGLYLWIVVSLLALWLVIVTPFFGLTMIVSGGQLPWQDSNHDGRQLRRAAPVSDTVFRQLTLPRTAQAAVAHGTQSSTAGFAAVTRLRPPKICLIMAKECKIVLCEK
jgi:hypothetical protein